MLDPFGSMQGFMNQFRGFMQQPMQMMMQKKLNLPANWMQDPRGAVQQLMNSGAMSQEQFNQLQRMAQQIQGQPQFQQFTQQMQGGQGQQGKVTSNY